MTVNRAICAVLCLFLINLACVAAAEPSPRVVTLKAADGTTLKATYFAAGGPGPGILLLHQCNQQRKSWDGLAGHLAASGMNVLTLDYRGFGESGGARFDQMTPEDRKELVTKDWPVDIELAYQYLASQPGVIRDMIGAGGASCGVDNSIRLARRHPEVKSLVLLSGPTDREGRLFLQSPKAVPIFVAAADDDVFGRLTETMQWLFSVSPNPSSRYAHYATGGHGTEMFAPHPDLPDAIVRWFGFTLRQSGNAPKTNGAALSPANLETLRVVDQPGGTSRVAKMLVDSRARDSNAPIFSEFLVNLLGYEHIQLGDIKGAVEIFKLNLTAYPDSPNVYDSLSDAYLADGQRDMALQSAKKALDLLSHDTVDGEERRNAIRDSAQQKVKQLSGPQS
jgi:dienelactone hydrolase